MKRCLNFRASTARNAGDDPAANINTGDHAKCTAIGTFRRVITGKFESALSVDLNDPLDDLNALFIGMLGDDDIPAFGLTGGIDYY